VSVEILKVSVMEKEIKKFNQYEKEHVMPFFYKNLKKGEIFEYIRKDLPKINKVNLAVDTIEDFQCFQKVFEAMKKGELKYTTDEIVNLVSKIRTFS
jgi:spore coat polysaccharide biosynthesis protein SpsF (cytidylyltransferase family)